MTPSSTGVPISLADAKEVLKRYEVWYIQDQDGVAARFPDFGWILTGGADLVEAEANALEAFALALDTLSEEGLPLPEPTRGRRPRTISLPTDTDDHLVRRAREEGVPVTELAARLLREAVG